MDEELGSARDGVTATSVRSAPSLPEGALDPAVWKGHATAAVKAFEGDIAPRLKRATDDLYEDLMYSIQEYLLENVLFNVQSKIDSAERQALGDRMALRVEQEKTADLRRALQETWRVLRAAGTLNLSRGVQLGQTSWYVKICDAEALSDAAVAKALSQTGGE